MNLLFLDSIDAATYGGMEEWIRLVSTGLAGRGHRVSVCGRRNSEFLRRLSGEQNLNLIPLDIRGDFDPFTIHCIKREIESGRTDFVVVNFNKDIRLGGVAAKLSGSPRVIWSAGLDITKDNVVHRNLTPRLLDGVIVPSKALSTQITKYGYIDESIVRVIPIGIPDISSLPGKAECRKKVRDRFDIPPHALVAVTSGRFVEQKGHRFLLEAIPRILPGNPDTFFLLLGDGPLESEIRLLADEMNCSANIRYAGMLDSVSQILAGCDIMVHPSIEEPFGIAIVEGMRAGLPVVASRVGGIPEVVSEGETASLVPPCDSDKLAEGVRELLDDNSRMKSYGERGWQRWRVNFSESMMIDRVENYFRKMLVEEQVNGNTKAC